MIFQFIRKKIDRFKLSMKHRKTRASKKDLVVAYKILSGREINEGQLKYLDESRKLFKWDHQVLLYHLLTSVPVQKNLNIHKCFDPFYEIETKEGFFLYGYHFDFFISKSLEKFKSFEDEVGNIIAQIAREDDVVLDVGANIGTITSVLASKISDKGKIYCIEALPTLVKLLEKAKAKNGWTQVEILNRAISNKVEELCFLLSYTNSGGSCVLHSDSEKSYYESTYPEFLYKAEAIDLDSLLYDKLDRLDFMKVDIEGCEHLLFQGASKIVKKFHPSIIMEFTKPSFARFGTTPEAFLNDFKSMGYKLIPLSFLSFKEKRDLKLKELVLKKSKSPEVICNTMKGDQINLLMCHDSFIERLN